MKEKEFLELEQGNRSVVEYEREFVYLSKYARKFVSTDEEMCVRFEDGLNDEIKLLVGAMEIRELVNCLIELEKWRKFLIVKSRER